METGDEQRWERRPFASWLIRVAVFCAPVAAGILAGRAMGALLPPPSNTGATIAYWALVLGAATGALMVVERLARRFLPLAWLLRMALLFPTRAPRRWHLARRVGTVRDLERHLAAARNAGVADDATDAAERIVTLITALQAHDRHTRGHAERVRVYTDMLTAELGLAEADRERLRWAALLHDIGKLAVSEQVLNKPGKPDEAEWQALVRHPEEGARFCGPLLEWLGRWGDTVIQHHERYDGQGYPAGLMGEEINEGARIVAVPDAYEVMTAPRPYKRVMSARVARAELADHAGTQFDPAVVRAFLNLSIRRLQWVAGPAAWLAQVPFLTRRPRMASGTASLGLSLAAVVVLSLGLGLGNLDANGAPTQPGAAPGGDAPESEEASDVAGATGGSDTPDALPSDPADPAAPAAPAEPTGDAEGSTGPNDEPDADQVVVILPPDDAVDPATQPDPDPDSDPGPVVVIVSPPRQPDPQPPVPEAPVPEPQPEPEPTVIATPPPPPGPEPEPPPPAPEPEPEPTDPEPEPEPEPTDPDPEPTQPPPPPEPQPAVAVADAATTSPRGSVTIPVLANDGGDLDAATLSVVSQPQHGSASAAGGAVVYQAQPGWSGMVAFAYRVCDTAGGCSTANVSVTVVR